MKEPLLHDGRKFKALIEKSWDVIVLLDNLGKITYVTPSIKRVLGRSQKDFLKKPVKFSLIHPDDRKIAQELFRKLMTKPKAVVSYQVRVLHKKGSYRWIEATGTNLLKEPGVEAIVVNFRDITDHIRVEQELKRSRDELEIILQGVADGISVQNAKGELLYVNNAAATMSGFKSIEEMMNAGPRAVLDRFELLDEFGNPFLLDKLPGRRALFGEMDPEEVIQYKSKKTGESKWSLVKARPIFDKSGNVIFSINIFHDITARRELERKKDEFIGIASHELKTPITTIKAFTQLFQKKLMNMEEEAFKRYLGIMDMQIGKLTELVGDLLDDSRIQSGKLLLRQSLFNIDKLVKETVQNFQFTVDSHIIIVKGKTGLSVVGDKERIGQVILNLLSNAVKYSPKSDKIVVLLKKNKKVVTVSVADFGIGIAKENQKLVFDRFFRASGKNGESAPGLGIGMYISSEIIRRHKGKIWVESALGRGSTFSFSLKGHRLN